MCLSTIRRRKVIFEKILLFLSASLIFIISGLSFLLKTNNGKLFIHDIVVESREGFPYHARLYRPVSASSIDPYPAVLLSYGTECDRSCGDYAAVTLTKNGFIVLSIESFGQGKTSKKPDDYTENCIDAGYTFLDTRSFTDHNNISLAVWTDAAETAADANSLEYFSSVVLVFPEENLLRKFSENRLHIYDKQTGKSEMIAGAKTLSFIINAFRNGAENNISYSEFEPTLLLYCRLFQIILSAVIVFCGADLFFFRHAK